MVSLLVVIYVNDHSLIRKTCGCGHNRGHPLISKTWGGGRNRVHPLLSN